MFILSCIVFKCEGGDGQVCFSHKLYKQHLSAAQMSSRQVSSLTLSCHKSSRGAMLSPDRTPRAVLLVYFCTAQDRTAAVWAKQSLSLPMDRILTAVQRLRLNIVLRQRNQQQLHSKLGCSLLCSLSVALLLGSSQNEPITLLARAPLALLHIFTYNRGGQHRAQTGKGSCGKMSVMLPGPTGLPINTETLNSTS